MKKGNGNLIDDCEVTSDILIEAHVAAQQTGAQSGSEELNVNSVASRL